MDLTPFVVNCFILTLTLPPMNEWGSKVQKISSSLSHQLVDAGWVQHKDMILFPLDFSEQDDHCHH